MATAREVWEVDISALRKFPKSIRASEVWYLHSEEAEHGGGVDSQLAYSRIMSTI